MHDVISKTLPPVPLTPLQKIVQAHEVWGTNAVFAAGDAIGMTLGEVWTEETVAKALAYLQDERARAANVAMLKRDELKVPAAAPAVDPLEGVREAIDTLLQAAVEDALDREFNRYGTTQRDPASMDGYIDAVLDEVRKLLKAKAELTP